MTGGDEERAVPDSRERLAQNLAVIRARIARAAEKSGRPAGAVRLVAVTKSVSVEEVAVLAGLGVTEFGESRLPQARDKIEALRARGLAWHMVGSLQRRKAREVVALFDYVDAVDRLELAETLQARCAEADRRLRVLVEVNVSGEARKHGFAPDELPAALVQMRKLDRLNVEGLMTMAPFGAEDTVLRRVFGALRALAETHGLPELSMGMSQDFEVAVEEGATQVRIGTALFD